MKKGIAFYLNLLAALLGAAGLGLAVYSSVLSVDNAITGLPLVIAAGVIGVVLVVLAAVAPARMGNHNPVTAISVIAAIALYSYVYGQCALQRIMLIAGLFSFNSGNTVGWTIFYVTVACAVCMVLACILLIVSSFCKTVKPVQQ